ncbi:hypothetical protein ACWCPG_34295, partial [Streptomyces sp. NPDC001919]
MLASTTARDKTPYPQVTAAGSPRPTATHPATRPPHPRRSRRARPPSPRRTRRLHEGIDGFLEAMTSDDPGFATARKYLTAQAER